LSELIEFKPVNRHLLIVPHFQTREDKTESGIFLPEDNSRKEDIRHIVATVVDVAADCNEVYKKYANGLIPHNREIIIDSTMIEEVPYKGKNFYLILENYVVGLLKG
jgi:co-chaperonin GroES (HSP10)